MKKIIATIILISTLFVPQSASAARAWSSGFEMGSNTSAVEFTLVGGGGELVDNTIVRSGSYSGEVVSGAYSSGVRAGWMQRATTGSGPHYYRFYVYVDADPNITTSIFNVSNGASFGSVAIADIRLTTSRTLQLFLGSTQVGSDSSALSADTWYRIEMLYDDTPADGSEEMRAYIDGVEFAGSNTLNTSTLVTTRYGVNLNAEAQTTATLYFDDLAVNNNTGSVQNALPGAGKIVHAYPNASGDNNSWEKSDSSAGDSNNYQAVDEVTPDDATTYLRRITSGVKIDDYNITNSSTLGIDSWDTISLVQVGVRGGNATTTTTSSHIDALVRIKGQASGTLLKSSNSALRLNTTGWETNGTSLPYTYKLVAYTNPQDGSAWTTTTLDTAQIGVETQVSSTQEIDITSVWAIVEYNDGTPPAAPSSGMTNLIFRFGTMVINGLMIIR